MDLGKALLIGLLIAGIIAALVPENLFANILGTGFAAMLVMMVLGIPIYVCATASVPVAAALILKGGISPGAALVFLMTGPATNAAAIATIWKLMGKRTAIVYLLTIATTALGSGVLLDYIYMHSGEVVGGDAHTMLPGYIKTISAIGLIAVLAYAIWRPKLKAQPTPEPEAAEKATLSIEGMTCSHCVENITFSLKECDGVNSVQVDLKTGKARITGERLDEETLVNAVENLGYSVEKAESAN